MAGRRLSGTLQEWPVGLTFHSVPPARSCPASPWRPDSGCDGAEEAGFHGHAEAWPSACASTCGWSLPPHLPGPPPQPLRTAPPTSAPSSTASGAVLPLATPAHPAGLSSNDATSPGAFLGCPSSRPAAPTFVSLCIAVLRHASQLSYSCDSLFDLPSLSPAPQTPP